jgi:hypothetical protein
VNARHLSTDLSEQTLRPTAPPFVPCLTFCNNSPLRSAVVSEGPTAACWLIRRSPIAAGRVSPIPALRMLDESPFMLDAARLTHQPIVPLKSHFHVS